MRSGNLHSDRVSKRDVFDLFHRYGRLAQISLKSAYGFVQYYNVADAQAAMQVLEGHELRGRKIRTFSCPCLLLRLRLANSPPDLEQSRTQKKGGDRERSPDRSKNRGGRGGDHHGRDQGRRQRDDYRPGRDASPRRDEHRRDDGYGRHRDRPRERSRSPARYAGRDTDDPYRQRSPSPYGRSRQEHDRLDIPRRYGDQVPDVQLLLMQELHRDFINWIVQAFYKRGLKTDVMFLSPRLPRDAVIQRQVVEGVLGVIELDLAAQRDGRIPLQVFDRSRGISNVRFDRYQDLEPEIAAELVLRTKAQASQQASYPPQHSYVQGYPLAPQALQAPQAYQGMPAAAQAPAPAQQGLTPELASLMGQMDSATLQKVLASLQSSAQPARASVPASGYPGAMPTNGRSAVPPANGAGSQIDINALLSSLKNAGGGTGGGPKPSYQVYGAPQHQAAAGADHGHHHAGGPVVHGGGDAAQQVQTIMSQLARYRQ